MTERNARFRRMIAAVAALGAIVAAIAWAGVRQRRPDLDGASAVERPPRIRPDYAGVVIPPNIAPLNFSVCEQGTRFVVRMRSGSGEALEIASGSPQIVIPSGGWRRLLAANRGGDLRIDVYRQTQGRWQTFEPIVIRIAEEDIDAHLVYRLIGPVYNTWREMAIYDRDLEGYGESVVLDGAALDGGCVNCHSFAANDPGRMLISTRSGKFGSSAIVARDDRAKKLDTMFGYSAWHPGGRIVAYSINKVWQFFHAAGPEVRDVIDLDAALAYCDVEKGTTKLVPRAADKERLETYPAWSPDGRYLYYCSAPFVWSDRSAMPPANYADIKYDLMRIAYDADSDAWGEPETVLTAAETGRSILLPRVSPDGRFLLFCMTDYGCFPAYQPSSDLYLMDLVHGGYVSLEINSEFSESWHSWSSNSRWIAFSSKRQSGYFTRCYISYVAPDGGVQKPFVVPQRDPEFYMSLVKTISVPELVAGPVPIDRESLAQAARSEKAIEVDAVTGPSRPSGDLEPWRQGSP